MVAIRTRAIHARHVKHASRARCVTCVTLNHASYAILNLARNAIPRVTATPVIANLAWRATCAKDA